MHGRATPLQGWLVHTPKTPASPRHWLARHIPGRHPRPTDTEPLWMEPKNLYSNKLFRWTSYMLSFRGYWSMEPQVSALIRQTHPPYFNGTSYIQCFLICPPSSWNADRNVNQYFFPPNIGHVTGFICILKCILNWLKCKQKSKITMLSKEIPQSFLRTNGCFTALWPSNLAGNESNWRATFSWPDFGYLCLSHFGTWLCAFIIQETNLQNESDFSPFEQFDQADIFLMYRGC